MAVERIVQYMVTAKVPDEVWTQYGDTQEFDRMFVEATKGSEEGGINSYSDVEMWCWFRIPQWAEDCDYKLRALVRHFEAKLKEQPRED